MKSFLKTILTTHKDGDISKKTLNSNAKPVSELRSLFDTGNFYTLTFKQVKNINLMIKKDGSIFVSAPFNTSYAFIDKYLFSKKQYILTHLEKLSRNTAFDINSFNYEDVSPFSYLGKNLTFRLIRANNNSIYVTDEFFMVFSKNPDDLKYVETQVFKFFASEAHPLFGKYLKEIYPLFSQYNFPYPSLTIRKMKRRWGSCFYNKSAITLNSALMTKSNDYIKYVITHELTHFVHPNHSKDFYKTLTLVMPNWKQVK